MPLPFAPTIRAHDRVQQLRDDFTEHEVRRPERIQALRRMIEHAEAAITDEVAAARRDGDSWAVIATALGTTRQSAHERYAQTGTAPQHAAPVISE